MNAVHNRFSNCNLDKLSDGGMPEIIQPGMAKESWNLSPNVSDRPEVFRQQHFAGF
jgi:hypothetical protein